MGGLEHLLQRGTQLGEIDKLLRKSLPPELRPHCQLANIKGSTMILLASSTVWASRLRYQSPQLLKALQQNDRLQRITEIQLRVQPRTDEPTSNKIARRASMSREAATYVHEFAESVDDESLRSALKKLASRQTEKI